MTTTMNTATEDLVTSFVTDCLPKLDKERLELELDEFVKRHCLHDHRPIALVTSGGTVANLEVNVVRCLDNFSTGLRGAISVEEFLRHGYAVIHLWRKGSASPYARVLNQLIGLDQANFALDNQHLDKLLLVAASSQNDNNNILSYCNSFTTTPTTTTTTTTTLNHGLVVTSSSELQNKLQERSHAVLIEQRLLTIPFWSIEEYLAKLQICSMALRPCGSMAILYLAAAVSDFYIPKSERSEHKISLTSSNNDVTTTTTTTTTSTTTTSNIERNGGADNKNDEGDLILTLRPVPKVLGLLRSSWAPDAYIVSFKLETDHAILRAKAERAVQRYGCHMVIGNLLSTRHTQVWVLAPPPPFSSVTSNTPNAAEMTASSPPTVETWPMEEISKPMHTIQSKSPRQLDDSLEEALINHVVESHLSFISSTSRESETMVRKVLQSEQDKRSQRQRRLHLQLWGKRIILGSILGYGAIKLAIAVTARSSET